MKKYLLRELDSDLKSEIEGYNDVFGNLKSEIEVEVFDAKENIVHFNRTIRKLRYLIKGKAKITMVHEDGKQSIVHFVKPKEYIGELTFLGIEKQPKNVIAICECICLAIPLEQAKESLVNDVNFILQLSRYIGSKLLNRTWFNTKNQNYELKNRLAAYILMSENNGIYQERHTETAEFLGVSYRHLLFTLKSFVEEGLLEKRKKGYKINSPALQVLAKDIDID